MFDMAWIDELDGDAAADAAVASRRALLEQEATRLRLAAHWADLHNGDARDTTGRALPGTERARRLGGPGTPRVLEFAAAELGALLQIGYVSAENLTRDALDLRHRHPRLWQAVMTGTARVWQAREVARLAHTAGLTLEQAHWVDAQTSHRLAGLPWTRFHALVEAKIIEADPDAAEARRVAAAMARFVRTGQSNEYGIKTIIARAEAGDAIFFLAMVDRIAQILLLQGDTDPADVRRSKAIGILANPTRAADLLHRYAGTTTDHGDDDRSASSDRGEDDAGPAEPIRQGDLHPADNDADDPPPERHPCPTCRGAGTLAGDSTAFRKPIRIDPAKLLPKAVLYIHLSEDSFTRDRDGVARIEGVGPATIEQAIDFLGHTHVTLTPVIDVSGQVPVDAYEVPAAMAQALHLRTPAGVFPYSPNLSRKKDNDHTIPYIPPQHGGLPGQTNLGNLGPMGRRAHRVKTHGRWRHLQPLPGVYLWRTPHGHWYRVDHTGTHHLGKHPDLSGYGITDTERDSSAPRRRPTTGARTGGAGKR